MTGFTVTTAVAPAVDGLNADMAATRAGLRSVAEILGQDLLALARRKAGGEILQVRSGDYMRGLSQAVVVGRDDVAVSLTASAPGAGLLEYGGTIPAHEIAPDVSGALRFMRGATAVYATSVNVPAIKVAPHPVVHAALDEMRGDIVDRLSDAGRAPWA